MVVKGNDSSKDCSFPCRMGKGWTPAEWASPYYHPDLTLNDPLQGPVEFVFISFKFLAFLLRLTARLSQMWRCFWEADICPNQSLTSFIGNNKELGSRANEMEISGWVFQHLQPWKCHLSQGLHYYSRTEVLILAGPGTNTEQDRKKCGRRNA